MPDQHPYLLRNVKVERPNQAWCADITYIPLSQGFMYLVAVMDWHSRRVLSWRLSNTLSADFCCEALQEALSGYGKPEIFNTDQGAQFTCDAFLDILRDAGVRISMDGRGRWMDNVFIERLWRTVKHEDVYLHCYGNPKQLRAGLDRFFRYYNEQRPHQALEYETPAEIHRATREWNPDTGSSPFHPDTPMDKGPLPLRRCLKGSPCPCGTVSRRAGHRPQKALAALERQVPCNLDFSSTIPIVLDMESSSDYDPPVVRRRCFPEVCHHPPCLSLESTRSRRPHSALDAGRRWGRRERRSPTEKRKGHRTWQREKADAHGS